MLRQLSLVLLPMVVLLALLAGCDSRASQVEKCVTAYVAGGEKEGPARRACMAAAYGNAR